jgi:predicted acylesterase/phospholipase RssA
VDYGDIHVWDIVKASWDGVQANSPDAVQNLMLASAGIPGVFPSRDVQGCLYVDGAITSNIIYGGRMKEEDSIWAVWHKQYPDSPMPRVRYWVIFNNQLRFQPQVTQPKWPDIIGRATIMSTQSSTVNAMRHLYAMAEIAKLKRSADVEVRVMAVPDSWVPPEPGVFKPSVMNELADLGEKLGADPASWRTESP